MKNNAMRNVCLMVMAAFGAVRTVSGAVDLTWQNPAFSIRCAGNQFVSNGVYMVYRSDEWRDVHEFQADDFRDTDLDQCFRLEPFAGAYPHPEFAADDPVSGDNNLTFSITGYRRSGAGVIAAFDFNTGDDHWIMTIENGASDDKPILVRRFGMIRGNENSVVFDVLMNDTSESIAVGEKVNVVVVWNSETLYLYVNGKLVETGNGFDKCYGNDVKVNGVRLGALPVDFEGLDLTDSTVCPCAAFDLSDVRCYAAALSKETCELLAARELGKKVQVSLIDKAWHTPEHEYKNATFRIGDAYGDLVSYRPTEDGLVFTGWTFESDSSQYVTGDMLVVTQANHRLVANWSNIVYHVNYNYKGFPGMVDTTYEITRGENYKIPEVDEVFDEGQFLGWLVGENTYLSANDKFPRGGTCGDETYYAAYNLRESTLRFEFGNGDADFVTNAYVGLYFSSYLPSLQPTRDGYNFVGWNLGDFPLQDSDTIYFEEEILTALWEGIEQTVNWQLYDGSVTTTTDSRSGELYNLPANPPTCNLNDGRARKFHAWVQQADDNVLNEIASWDWEEMMWDVNEDVTVLPKTHTNLASWWFACDFDPAGGSLDASSITQTWFRIQARADEWATLPVPDRFGYVFNGWWYGDTRILDETEIGTNETDLVSGTGIPQHLVAHWQAEKVNVVLHIGDENDSTQETTLDYNSEFAALPEVTRPGFALEGWHYSHAYGVPVAATSRVETLSTIDLFAQWSNATYRVDYKVLDTILDGKSIWVTHNGTWPELLDPASAGVMPVGAEFTGWHLNAADGIIVRTGDTASDLVTNSVLIATFAGVPCDITLDPNGGSLDVDSRTITVRYNEVISGLPTTVVREGREFYGWYGSDGRRYQNGDTWTGTGGLVLFAKWIGTTDVTLTYVDRTADGLATNSTVTTRYNKPMDLTGPAIAQRSVEGDTASFLGWYNIGGIQVYDANNKLVNDFTNGCPYEANQTLVAHWSIGRDMFAGAYKLTSGVANRVVGFEATDEAGEGEHSDARLRATHWYRFVGETNDLVTIRFVDNSGIDPSLFAIALYSGTSITNLQSVANFERWEKEGEFSVRLPRTDAYRLVVAQDANGAALVNYELTVSGFTGPKPSTITFDPNGGTISFKQRTRALSTGDELTDLPIPTRFGYDFMGWEGPGGRYYTNGDVWDLAGSQTLTAVWVGNSNIMLTFRSCSTDGYLETTNVVTRYGLQMDEIGPAVWPRIEECDDAQFVGWYNGTNQVYDSNNRLLPAYANGCPYQSNQTLIAHWSGGRDFFAGAFDPMEEGSWDILVVGYEGTREDGEPQHSASNLGSSHWYKFVGAKGDELTFYFRDASDASNIVASIAIYEGESLSSLLAVTNVETTTGEIEFNVKLPASGDYRVAVSEDSSGPALLDYGMYVYGDFTSAEKYNITLDSNGATNNVAKTLSVYEDGFLRGLPEPARPGFAFRGWVDDDGVQHVNGEILEGYGLSQLHAVWESITDITLTFVSCTSEGELVSTNVTTRYGRELDKTGPIPPPRADGDDAGFAGWFNGSDQVYDEDNELCYDYDLCTYTTNQTLVAHWWGRSDADKAFELSTNVTYRVLGYEPGSHCYRFSCSTGDTISVTISNLYASNDPAVTIYMYKGLGSGAQYIVSEWFEDGCGTLEITADSTGDYSFALESTDGQYLLLLDYEITVSIVPAPVIDEDYQPYPAWRIGACSWSWETNEVTILDQMDLSGAKCLHLAIDLDRTEEYLVALTNTIATNGYTVTATKFVLPGEDWTSRETVSNTCGLVRTTQSGEWIGMEEWERQVLVPITNAVAQTVRLGASAMTINAGYLKHPVFFEGTNMNENGEAAFVLLNLAIDVCSASNVRLILETGLETAEETAAMLTAFESEYPGAGTVGVCFDPADHLIFCGENPNSAFYTLQDRIEMIHIRDTFASDDRRIEESGSFAGDVKWGDGDVGVEYAFLSYPRNCGWVGYSFVERTSGTNRIEEIRRTIQLMLLANNTDDTSKWVSTSSMVGNTDDERREAVLKTSGFARATSARMAETNRYEALQAWTEVSGVNPTELSKAAYPITQAAFDLEESPKEVVLEMLQCEPISGSTDGETKLKFKISSDFAKDGACDMTLLEAAITVEGSTTIGGPWSTDNLTYKWYLIDIDSGEVGIKAKPKQQDGKQPTSFFFRGVAY